MTHTWAVTDKYLVMNFTDMREMLSTVGVTGDIVAEVVKVLWLEAELQHPNQTIKPNGGRLSFKQRVQNIEKAFRGIPNISEDGFKIPRSSGEGYVEPIIKNDNGELVKGFVKPRLGEDDLPSIYLRFLRRILEDDAPELSRLRSLCNELVGIY